MAFTFAGWLIFALLMNAGTIRDKRRKKQAGESDADVVDGEHACAEISDEDGTGESVVAKALAGDEEEDDSGQTDGSDDDEYDFETDSTKLEEALNLAERLYKNKQNNDCKNRDALNK